MTSDALPKVLLEFGSKNTSYLRFHGAIDRGQELLGGFLMATLDEVRLHHAEQYARAVLDLTDLGDARHFRQAVLRREASSDVEYQRQRDHAAHTLHNYLLGWYVFEGCERVQNEMRSAVEARGPLVGKAADPDHGRHGFVHAWPYVSLLHDIGYIFEGGLDVLSVESRNARVERGAKVAEEYFRHRFWNETSFAAATHRERVREWSGIEEPEFSPYTVTAVGDALRSLGQLEVLWAAVMAELRPAGATQPSLNALSFRGRADAFRVWKSHYEVYSPTMVRRLENMEKVFSALLWDGLPGLGLRILDHGVAGGLLQLLYASYYFQMHFGILAEAGRPGVPHKEDVDELVGKISGGTATGCVPYNASHWWTTIVWATGATALHNVQQMKQPWPGCTESCGALSLEEDPLAYMGILVDILQEWDRYTVTRSSIFTGELPLQGKDTKLGTQDGKIVVSYDGKERSVKVRRELTAALCGWEDVVIVLPE